MNAGENVTVTGTGAVETPYVISVTPVVVDPMVDRILLTLSGSDPGVDSEAARFLVMAPGDALAHIGPSLVLDGSDATVVRTVFAGVYAASLTALVIVETGNRGSFMTNVHIDVDNINASSSQSGQMVADDQVITMASTVVWWSPANGKISIAAQNGGGLHQDVQSIILAIQRIS